MAKKYGALFDLDGVLVDSESIYTEFWDSVDQQYPTGVKNFAHVIKGNTLERILSTYFPDKLIQEKILVLLKCQEEEMVYRLFDGVEDLLCNLRKHDVAIAIVTSSSPQKMHNLFSQVPQLQDLVDQIITDADVTKSKPDPQGYLLAAERLGCVPEHCIVLEDSFSGIEAGRRAGAKVIGVATTNPRESLINKADLVIDNVADLDLCVFEQL